MSMWLLSFSVQIANRVLVKCLAPCTVQDMIKSRRVRKTEYAVSTTTSAITFFKKLRHQGTYDGVNLGAQTIAMLSGIMT